MSDDEKLIEQLRDCADRLWGADKRRVSQAADALTCLREENARQVAEIEAANAAHRDMAARLARMGEALREKEGGSGA